MNLISNLFRLTFGIILLPLRLLGIPMAIIGGIVHFLMRNLFIVLVVIATILVYRSCTSDHTGGSMNQVKPAYRTPKQAKNRGNGPIIINPVTVVEDGDSAFATDVYATMSDEERAAYSQTFFWVMDNVKDGESHSWSNLNIAGSLRPADSFTNNVGGRCRRFSEVLKVHEVQQTVTGIACENADGSWCKLKVNATPGCNLGQPAGGGLLDSIGGSIRDLF